MQPEFKNVMDKQLFDGLEFVYQVTDMEGNPKTSFREGENFLLSFTVNNSGKEKKIIEQEFFPLIDDFFAVYKISGEGKALMGKPFDIGVNTKDYWVVEIAPQTWVNYHVPWVVRERESIDMPVSPNAEVKKRNYWGVETPSLDKGEYVSGFTLTYKEQPLEFKITFTIN